MNMKTYKSVLSLILWIAIFGNIPQLFSQVVEAVGINTTTPRKTLEVDGNVEISGYYDIDTKNVTEDADEYTFLIQKGNGDIRYVDLSNPTGAALGYIQEYIIVNAQQDWVLNFDTGIDAVAYTLVATSAAYDVELKVGSSSSVDNFSLPYTAAFKAGGTWHIIADYPSVANRDVNEIGTWTIQTLIFSNDLSKDLGSFDIEMGGATNGSALSPIID